jgi:hypothetical protein
MECRKEEWMFLVVYKHELLMTLILMNENYVEIISHWKEDSLQGEGYWLKCQLSSLKECANGWVVGNNWLNLES